MKTKPRMIGMPYAAPMLLKKLKGEKDVTRRLMNPQPNLHQHYAPLKPKHGLPGDRQYWQEAFDFQYVFPRDPVALIRYKADGVQAQVTLSESDCALARQWKRAKTGYWRGMPAMFMLRSMSRGMDDIVSVRDERLQDITYDDSIREGIEQRSSLRGNAFSGNHGATWWHNSILAYKDLWDTIYAKRAPWASNPWCWRYETKAVAL